MAYLYIIIAALAVLALVGGIISIKISRDKEGAVVTTIGAALVLIIATGIFSFATVPAQSVGVQTTFGKPQGVLESGPHFKSPVASVEKFSTRVQFLDLTGDSETIPVSYNGGGGGSVKAVVRWRTTEDRVISLWQDYRTFDRVRDELVKSSAADSFRVVLAGYTPSEARSGDNLRKISEAAQADLEKTLKAKGVVIDSVSVKNIALDKQAQASLDRVVSSSADIERAQKEQERARIDAETNKLRQASLTPQALQRYCLDVTNNWSADKNGALPAGWTCNGVGAPMVVTGK